MVLKSNVFFTIYIIAHDKKLVNIIYIKVIQKGDISMKFRKNISQWIKNKKGSGEIVVVLLLMVLGLFFLTKYVFKIPFPFTSEKQVESVEKTEEK